MKTFDIIVAHDKNNGIGRQQDLPWKLKEDLQRFKKITCQTQDPSLINAVIMGRKTWESLPQSFRPLPQRKNVVLSQTLSTTPHKETLLYGELNQAIESLSQDKHIEKLFVIGGGQLYQQAIHHPQCQNLWVTLIHNTFDCDTFFPTYPKEFQLKDESILMSSDSLQYQFLLFSK